MLLARVINLGVARVKFDDEYAHVLVGDLMWEGLSEIIIKELTEGSIRTYIVNPTYSRQVTTDHTNLKVITLGDFKFRYK